MTVRGKAVLFAHVEPAQHEALRRIAYRERRSVADLAREAVSDLIARRRGGKQKAK